MGRGEDTRFGREGFGNCRLRRKTAPTIRLPEEWLATLRAGCRIAEIPPMRLTYL
jgi:hypothetical protein